MFSTPAYLVELTLRLARAIGHVPAAVSARTASYVRLSQQSDGGFSGREGMSDLYYTGFALRTLAMLGELHGPIAELAADYLRGKIHDREPLVDFLSLIFSASLLDASAGIDVFADQGPTWRDRIADDLEQFRRDDGGFARSREGAASSTYQSFLIILALQLLGRPIRDPARLAEFVLSQQREDGGFVELRVMRSSGTNPTAAAVSLLRIVSQQSGKDCLTEKIRNAAGQFLADRQTTEGGLAANTRIPVADVLSTFTGTLTLAELGLLCHIDTGRAGRFVESMAQPDGSFIAAAWDDGADVEYTFYGLAAMGLLCQVTSGNEQWNN